MKRSDITAVREVISPAAVFLYNITKNAEVLILFAKNLYIC